LTLFQSAINYLTWQPHERCSYLASVIGLLFKLKEIRPEEEIPAPWESMLTEWLMGNNANQMSVDPEKVTYQLSPAEISNFIDNAFGYKAPWGLNALTFYLEEIARERGVDLPEVTGYLSALVKYGVHSPAASSLLAFGLASRQLALSLSRYCPDELLGPDALLTWFLSLTPENLTEFGFFGAAHQEIMSAQTEAGRVTDDDANTGRTWKFSLPLNDSASSARRWRSTTSTGPGIGRNCIIGRCFTQWPVRPLS